MWGPVRIWADELEWPVLISYPARPNRIKKKKPTVQKPHTDNAPRVLISYPVRPYRTVCSTRNLSSRLITDPKDRNT